MRLHLPARLTRLEPMRALLRTLFLPIEGRLARIVGTPAIYAVAGGDLKLRTLAYSTDGSTGYIIGAYRYGTAAADVGKFVLALQKGADGKWLIAADIDNGNRR